MKVHAKYGATLVAQNDTRGIPILLEVQAPEAPPIERAPLDVMIVIDRSGSMAGQPLDAVKQAVAGLIRLATPQDRIGVVAFDDTSRIVVPLRRHDSVDDAVNEIMSIQAGGSTNLSGGWLMALDELRESVRHDAVRRIVLLTDGHANVGLDKVETFGPIVTQARTEGVTTSCIGFADGFDEEFLAGVADAGAGNDYWCAGADQAGEVFNREFQGLASVVAQNLEVSFVPTDATTQVEVGHDFPTNRIGSRVVVTMGDIYGSETRRLLLTVLPASTSSLGALGLGTFTAKWTSIIGDAVAESVDLPVGVTVVPTLEGVVDEGASSEVADVVRRLAAERDRRLARALANRGEFEAAAWALRAALVNFEFLGDAREVALCTADIDSLSNRTWSSSQSKKQYSRSRSSSKGRRVDFDDDSK